MLKVLVVFFASAFSVYSHAASFDCTKARTEVEKIVCQEKDISELDDELALKYGILFKVLKESDRLKEGQLEWLKTRNKCSEKSCILNNYRKRIYELHQAEAEWPIDIEKALKIMLQQRDIEIGIPYADLINSINSGSPEYACHEYTDCKIVGVSLNIYPEWCSKENIQKRTAECREYLLFDYWVQFHLSSSNSLERIIVTQKILELTRI